MGGQCRIVFAPRASACCSGLDMRLLDSEPQQIDKSRLSDWLASKIKERKLGDCVSSVNPYQLRINRPHPSWHRLIRNRQAVAIRGDQVPVDAGNLLCGREELRIRLLGREAKRRFRHRHYV